MTLSHDYKISLTQRVYLLQNSIRISHHLNPGWVAQLVRPSSWYAKVAGSFPSQGTYKNQPVNAQMGGAADRSLSL